MECEEDIARGHKFYVQAFHNTHVKLRRCARVVSICTSMPESATRCPSCKVLITKYGQLSMAATTNSRPSKSLYCCSTSGTTDVKRRALVTLPDSLSVPAGTSLDTRCKNVCFRNTEIKKIILDYHNPSFLLHNDCSPGHVSRVHPRHEQVMGGAWLPHRKRHLCIHYETLNEETTVSMLCQSARMF